MAGFVFEKQGVVLGGGDAGAAIVVAVSFLVVHWQHRHGRELRVRRKKGPHVKHRAEWDVPQVGRGTVIADDAIGKQGEGVWVVAEEHPGRLHSDAASAIGMIHEDKFASVGVRFLQGGKLPCFGTEDVG